MLVVKVIVDSVSAPNKCGLQTSKENYVRVIPSPMKRNQRTV